MSLWIILPISLPVFILTGIWVVYAMALYNQHVCPLNNWLYNDSCEELLSLQRGPVLCCTLENLPLISKSGTLPPESCFFSLVCSTGSFMVMMIGLLRYALVIERHQNCVLNTAGLCTCWVCAAGLLTAGNFQLDYAKVLHYVGAGVAFTCSMVFVSLQTALTYRLAKTQHEYLLGHIRLTMSLLTFMALVLGGGFFCVEASFALQHISAILEWVFCMLVMLFYGTFAFEFSAMSANTLVVLSRGGGASSSPFPDPVLHHKMEASSAGCYPADSLAMLYSECGGGGGDMTSQHVTQKLSGGGAGGD
ncbi:transmembrane protein 150A [Gadus morhua]|uniref:Transmembrane protein 150A-like n=1 Tax=Gadus morhua TaxID=8049 RepID=A0A8C4Z5M9_GADMO|nr:transmembrane protein 150A-like [Gadus morhua]